MLSFSGCHLFCLVLLTYLTSSLSIESSNANSSTENNEAVSVKDLDTNEASVDLDSLASAHITKLKHGKAECEECFCDTTVDCTVNCCCDKNCNSADKLIFASCLDTVSVIDRRYCQHSQVVFKHHNVSKSVTASPDSLFCQVPIDDVKRKCHVIHEVAQSEREFQIITENKHTWSETENMTQLLQPKREMHMGQPIPIQFLNGEMGFLGLPYESTPGECNGPTKPILYLVDQEVRCTRSNVQFENQCKENIALKVSSYINFTLQYIFGEANLTDNFTDTILQLEPVSFFCRTTLKYMDTCNATEPSEPTKYNATTGTCTNVVEHVQYQIFHNASRGIVQVEIYLFVRNWQNTSTLTQTFQAFFHKNNSEGEVILTNEILPGMVLKRRSGNPGYLFDKPVLAVLMVSANKSFQMDETSPYLKFFSGEASDNNCRTSTVIYFRKDITSICSLSVAGKDSKSICGQLRTIIYNMIWNISQNSVGIFGNSNPNIFDEWVPIVSADLVDENNISSCQNFPVGFELVITYANVGPKITPQAKIIGVIGKVFKAELTFPSSNLRRKQAKRAEIVFSVRFVDATMNK